MKYLTNGGYKLIEKQIADVNKEIIGINNCINPGTYVYRLIDGYKEGLEFILDEELRYYLNKQEIK